jgi:predicted RND superfamily exporter protein
VTSRVDRATQSAAHMLVRQRWPLMAGLAALTLLAGWRATRLEFDFSFRSFFLERATKEEFAATVVRQFGNAAGSYLVAVLQGDDVFRADVIGRLEDMNDDIERIAHVERAFDLAVVPYIHGAPDGVSFATLGDLAREGEDLGTLRPAVLASPLYARRLVSTDGRVTAVVALLESSHQGIETRRPTIEAFRAAVLAHLPPGFRVLFTGYPVGEAEYARLIWRGFLSAEAVAIVAMALALYACFRTLVGVLLPLLTVGVSVVLTLGFMEATGHAITMTSASVPLFMLVLGVSEVCFLVARYYEEAARIALPRDAVVRAAAAVVPAGLAAAATTSAGFIALYTGHIGLTRDFGLVMAVGIAAIAITSVALVPGVLSLLGRPPERAVYAAAGGWNAGLLSGIARFDERRPRLVLAGALVVVALGALGASRMKVEQYATRELRADNPVRVAQDVVDGGLTGAFQTQVALRRRDGASMADPETLREMETLAEFLATQPHVLKVWSIVDYLKELNMVMEGASQSARQIPDDPKRIEQYLLLLASGGRTSDVPSLIDPAHRMATIVIGTTDLGTGDLIGIHDRAEQFVRERFGDRLEMRFVGDYWFASLGADSLTRDLAVGIMTSFLLVFGLVVLFFRSWRLTLLSIPPNVVPLAAAAGLMGFAHLPLRVGTSIILPVSLGITVDFTIQYLARVRQEWSVDHDYAAATRRALLGAGRAMTFAAVVLILGFLSLLIPEFLVFRHLGLLGGWTMLIALLANLFVTPVLVMRLRPLGTAVLPEPASVGVSRNVI